MSSFCYYCCLDKTKEKRTMLVLFVAVAAATTTLSDAWQMSPLVARQHRPGTVVTMTTRTSRRRTRTVLRLKEEEEDEEDEDALLTDLDARVLQSMLADDKLNLDQEDNMKKLLERGIKSTTPSNDEQNKAKEEESSPYASQVLKTLGDTKLWKALSRNAEDFWESAKIVVRNRVERDAKLLGTLGLFAFERALKDVGRALPAAASVVAKTPALRQLGASSSFNNNTDEEATTSERIRQDMSTPADEWKQISRDLREILESGGDVRPMSSTTRLPSQSSYDATSTTSTTTMGTGRGLRSTASSKRGKDRFQKAFVRQQNTKLAREKENLAQTSTRLASNVIDSAYQIKREVEVEPNQPGYKTKALREGVVETTKILSAGAKDLLGGAKRLALGSESTPSSAAETNAIETSASVSNVQTSTTSSTPAVDASTTASSVEIPVNTRIPYVSTTGGTTTTTTTSTVKTSPSLDVDASSSSFTTESSSSRTREELLQVLQSEISNLSQRLGRCITKPEETWLDPNLILSSLTMNDVDNSSESSSSLPLDRSILESIVTSMVQLQSKLQLQPSASMSSFEESYQILVVAKKEIERTVQIASAAAAWNPTNTANRDDSNVIASYLEQYLIFDTDCNRGEQKDEDQLPFLLRLDAIQQEWNAAETTTSPTTDPARTVDYFASVVDTVGPEESSSTPKTMTVEELEYFMQTSSQEQEQRAASVELEEEEDVIFATKFTGEEEEEYTSKDSETTASNVIAADIVDVVPDVVVVEPSSSFTASTPFADETLLKDVLVEDSTEEEVDDMRRVSAEIVSDDKFEDAVGQAKTVETVPDMDFDDEGQSEPNPAVQMALRSLDVAFLAIEKTMKVRARNEHSKHAVTLLNKFLSSRVL